MPINWNDYRFFLAVARSGRLSVAGRQLGVDHATVARRIKSLEDAVKTILFDRAPTGYTLTAAGTELVAIAERIESEALLAEDTIGTQLEDISGIVRVGAPDGATTYILSEIAQKICEEYPRLEIQLLVQPQKFSLSKREVDFIIGISQPETGRLRVQKIASYGLHLYGSNSYLSNHPPVNSVADLKKLRGISYVPALIFEKELDFLPLIDRTLRPHLTSTSIHMQLRALLNGAGVGILPDYMAMEHDDLVKLMEHEISFTRNFWYIVKEDYAELKRIRVVAKGLIEGMRAKMQTINNRNQQLTKPIEPVET